MGFTLLQIFTLNTFVSGRGLKGKMMKTILVQAWDLVEVLPSSLEERRLTRSPGILLRRFVFRTQSWPRAFFECRANCAPAGLSPNLAGPSHLHPSSHTCFFHFLPPPFPHSENTQTHTHTHFQIC